MGSIVGYKGANKERHFFYYFDEEKYPSHPHGIIYTETEPPRGDETILIGNKISKSYKDPNIKGYINFPKINFKIDHQEKTLKFILGNKEFLNLSSVKNIKQDALEQIFIYEERIQSLNYEKPITLEHFLQDTLNN